MIIIYHFSQKCLWLLVSLLYNTNRSSRTKQIEWNETKNKTKKIFNYKYMYFTHTQAHIHTPHMMMNVFIEKNLFYFIRIDLHFLSLLLSDLGVCEVWVEVLLQCAIEWILSKEKKKIVYEANSCVFSCRNHTLTRLCDQH